MASREPGYLEGMLTSTNAATHTTCTRLIGLVLIALLMLVTLPLGACAGRPDVTGGYAFTFRAADNRSQLLYYEMKADGTFAFVGGVRAGFEADGLASPTWSAHLSRDELGPVLDLLVANAQPATTEPDNAQMTYKLSLTTPGGTGRYVSGPTPFFTELLTRCRDVMIRQRPELGDPSLRPYKVQ